MQSEAQRQSYIDWLRVGAIFLLIFYHSGRLFDEPGWHIKNTIHSFGIEVLNRFLDIWMMPLFFLLAGAAVWFALGRRTPGAFAKERVLRLFVPLVFGILVLVPPQVYLERVFDGDFTGSFWAWYPNTFSGTYSTDNTASGNFSWHHLWFLAYLFVFSMLLLPLFWYLKKWPGAIAGFARFVSRPGAIFLAAVPLVVIELLLRQKYGWGNQNLVADWANFLFYLCVVLYGFLLVSNSAIIQAVRRQCYWALGAAAVLSAGIYVTKSGLVPAPVPVYLVIRAVACWCWLLAIIGIGSLLLSFSNRFLKYANEAVLPVYILHQTIIVTFGFFAVQWDMPVMAKYFLTAAVTTAISLAIYEGIRRWNLTRFLFGMKRQTRPAKAMPAS